MSSDAVYADTVLRDKAVEAVRDLVSQHGLPVQRSQIAGLRQIAGNEPALLKDFVDHQRDRAQVRFADSGQKNTKFKDEAQFWETIGHLCAGRPPRSNWSLEQDADKEVQKGPDIREEKLPPGAKLTREEQAARRQREGQRNEIRSVWRRRFYPIFFQHFCAEYLYRMAIQPGKGAAHDDDSDD